MAVFHFSFVLVVLVLLVLLVVIFIFFSLFLQLVLRQRIVDIYDSAKNKKFFVPIDCGTTTWRIRSFGNPFFDFPGEF